jgi:hypothetical protein
METYADLNPGKYLKADDVKGMRLIRVIDHIAIEAMEDKKRKHVAHFRGHEQALVLNKTRYLAIEEIAGTSSPEKWKGTKVVLTAGKTTFAGKSTDCIVVDKADGEEAEGDYA